MFIRAEPARWRTAGAETGGAPYPGEVAGLCFQALQAGGVRLAVAPVEAGQGGAVLQDVRQLGPQPLDGGPWKTEPAELRAAAGAQTYRSATGREGETGAPVRTFPRQLQGGTQPQPDLPGERGRRCPGCLAPPTANRSRDWWEIHNHFTCLFLSLRLWKIGPKRAGPCWTPPQQDDKNNPIGGNFRCSITCCISSNMHAG